MKQYDAGTSFLDKEIEFAFDLINKQKDKLFSELLYKGYSEEDINEFIDRSMFEKDSSKKERSKRPITIFHLIIVCMNEFVKLCEIVGSKKIHGNLMFKIHQLNLSFFMIALGQSAIMANDKDFGSEYVEEINILYDKIAEASKQARKEITDKARLKKKKSGEKKRESIKRHWEDMKREDPNISKDRASRKIYDDYEKNEGLAESTIRKYLRNV